MKKFTDFLKEGERGLWDNIRANIGSGKAPTKEMLKQEKKIKLRTKKKKK